MAVTKMKGDAAGAGPMVPLIVDSVKKADDFQMARMSYWVIDYRPEESILSHLSAEEVDILTTDAHGILLGPPGPESVFSSGEILNDTFDQFGKSLDVGVETASLWLPIGLLADVHKEFTDGDVFRVSAEVLTLGRRFGMNVIGEAEYLDSLSKLDPARHVQYSEDESRAMVEWSELQIADKRRQYEEMKKDNRPLSYLKGKKGKE